MWREAANLECKVSKLGRCGTSYSESEYDAWLRDAGFRGTKHVRLPAPANLMIGTK
jgi:hypothetical protein